MILKHTLSSLTSMETRKRVFTYPSDKNVKRTQVTETMRIILAHIVAILRARTARSKYHLVANLSMQADAKNYHLVIMKLVATMRV